MAFYQRTIVIVEDEPDTAEMLAEMMRLNGYQVRKVYNGRPAMTIIAQEKPDAVLLDVMMPDISGLEVLNFMKHEPSLTHIPVVIVSAKCQPADIDSGYEAGAMAYLTKPVAYVDLKRTMASAIQEYR